MALARRIREHRPTIVLAVLVLLSLGSMAGGTRAAFFHDRLRAAVSVTAYPFVRTLRATEHGVDYVTGFVLAHNDARREAEFLRRRLGDMMQHAASRNELSAQNERLRRMMDFERRHPEFVLEPAAVVQSFKGVIIIDRGSEHGIRESMCVVTEEGIVGVVTKTDLLTSNVVTLHNADCKVGVMVRRNRVRGSLHGTGSDLASHCTMNYVDMTGDVRVDDEVVTSPESVFPAGVPVGRVDDVTADKGALWKRAAIMPAVAPYQLDEVFVLRQALAGLEELAGIKPREEVPVPVSAPVPDVRPLQERYAP